MYKKPHEALQVLIKSSVRYRPAIHHHKSLQHVHVTCFNKYNRLWHPPLSRSLHQFKYSINDSALDLGQHVKGDMRALFSSTPLDGVSKSNNLVELLAEIRDEGVDESSAMIYV
jgi:hypothetical protein